MGRLFDCVRWRTSRLTVAAFAVLVLPGLARGADEDLAREVFALFRARCVKCHGPAERKGKLDLSQPTGVAKGGGSGPVLVAHHPDESLLLERVRDGEMPPMPAEPLKPEAQNLIRRWIEQGAPGVRSQTQPQSQTQSATPEDSTEHWAFQKLAPPQTPSTRPTQVQPARGLIDRFVLADLEPLGASLAPKADRATLIRRLSFDLTGLPPSPEEIDAFLTDHSSNAYERLVDRLLASPAHGARWGKLWLDAVGYADSNGYFNADSPRPLAYRYRDYVIRSVNADKPLDQFVREQLAGDELARFRPGAGDNPTLTPELIDWLEATHFLRNAQDGTGESDGNPDEVRADRYSVIEGTVQVIGSSFLGLTLQCARCHDHKFEPVTQKDYYQLQAILAPAFDLKSWLKPNERVVEAALPGELADWRERSRKIDAEIEQARREHKEWARSHRETGDLLFQESFETVKSLGDHWSATAPGDDQAGGAPVVTIADEGAAAPTAPAAVVREGALLLLESGGAGNRWISTKQAFDWTPNEPTGWIQVTFDLIDIKPSAGAPAAERVAFYLALHDYNDNSPRQGGNVLIDGNPAGGASVHVDYPGSDARQAGTIGGPDVRFVPRTNLGARITRVAGGDFLLEAVVDGSPVGPSVKLKESDLPDGGFGFEYCCNRSFVVDNLRIERAVGGASQAPAAKHLAEERARRLKALNDRVKALEAGRGEQPGRIAWVSDQTLPPPPVFLLKRGQYGDPGPVVPAEAPAILREPGTSLEPLLKQHQGPTSGRRLAFARWLTQPETRASALLARVLVNRLWQGHFGSGLVATPENLGLSGAAPSNLALLDALAFELTRSGWRAKAVHRRIVLSSVYRQSSAPRPELDAVDPDARRLGRFPLQRLDAESIRDGMLAASGELDTSFGGPAIPTQRDGSGEVRVEENAAGKHRRAVFLQQRRTQVLTFLDVFDAPSIVTTCTRRLPSTIPLQSLSLLNSDFARERARGLVERASREVGTGTDPRLERMFLIVQGRPPEAAALALARHFLAEQPSRYPTLAPSESSARAWVDLAQMLLASNSFLYVD